MINPDQMQNRRLQIMHMDAVFRDIEAEFVGTAVDMTAPYPIPP